VAQSPRPSLLAFQRRYQQTAMPFDWCFTRVGLDWLLHRLDERPQSRDHGGQRSIVVD
jgi:hypothetical protein